VLDPFSAKAIRCEDQGPHTDGTIRRQADMMGYQLNLFRTRPGEEVDPAFRQKPEDRVEELRVSYAAYAKKYGLEHLLDENGQWKS